MYCKYYLDNIIIFICNVAIDWCLGEETKTIKIKKYLAKDT